MLLCNSHHVHARKLSAMHCGLLVGQRKVCSHMQPTPRGQLDHAHAHMHTGTTQRASATSQWPMTHSVSVAPLRHSVMTNSALPGMTTTREQLMHEYMPMPPPYAHPHMTCRLTCNSPMKQSTATHVDFLHVNNRRSNNHPTNRCNIVLRMPLLRGVADFLRVFLRVLFGRQPESIALLTQSLEAALEVEPICYLHLTLRISFTDSVPPACKGRVWGTGVQFGMCPNKSD
mmetsp:Transcript_26962/g.81626  ORF Transcript_26962/g.81626 Transcript_26962/m.81626 type:complete len:230 (+) Transcript_26962:127-816(+)